MSAILPPVIEFKNVSKTFNPGERTQFTALRDINFTIDDIPHYGEFIGIVGPSGCGKSTILNLIHGFDDVYPPTTGEVLVRGRKVAGPGRDRGMIFQKYSSFPHRTVLENVTFGLELNESELKLGRSERVARARDWIRKVGLAGHEHKYPHQLSGGQQQRVAIARSLVLKPQIILMDEPFSALDIQTRQLMENEVLDLWAASRKAVLFITHDLDEAIAMSDRVVVMSAGPASHPIGEFPINLPRPRDVAEIRTLPEFVALHEQIWAVLREEVLKAREELR